MNQSAPLIDGRDAEAIKAQVRALLQRYAPELALRGNPPQLDALTEALIGVFGRYAEVIIQRLNQAPQKNFLAFLDLLGASLLPPQPARVPVTFSLAAGSASDASVPAGTQVAAPPAEGQSDPVIYETEHELMVTAVQLAALFVRDPLNDQYADLSDLLPAPATAGEPAFLGNEKIEHALYIGLDAILSFPAVASLTLNFTVDQQPPGTPDQPLSIQWEIWNGAQSAATLLQPASDTTNSLTQTGSIVFPNVPQVARQSLQGTPSRWLRARLLTPITNSSSAPDGMVSAANLPIIRSLTASAAIDLDGPPVEKAFTNLLPVDTSKDFLPLGEKPRFGDTLYLANAQAFSQPGATIKLHVSLTDPAKSGVTPATNGGAALSWETWDGSNWVLIGTSDVNGNSTPGLPNGVFKDGTKAFTNTGGGDTVVELKLPDHVGIKEVNGVSSYWLRVRLSGGNYGVDASYREITEPGAAQKSFQLVLATFAPPSISKVSIHYTLNCSENNPQIKTVNDFRTASPVAPFVPYTVSPDDPTPALYLGFILPASRLAFPNRTLSIYFQLADVLSGQKADNPAAAAVPRLVWEYWNGFDWEKLVGNDGTNSLTHSGLVELLPPADFQAKSEFGLAGYWLRLRWDSGDYKFFPRLRAVLLNTTTATQTVTIRGETLGSSSGGENMVFHTTHAPVLLNQQLQVREAELPAAEERALLFADEGPDAILVENDAAGRPNQIWVRWHPVPDFYGSGARDRDYVIDHLSGEVRFGNGMNGRIPPVGSGNVRMLVYQTGGGAIGNRPAGAIVQLKTTVPYVDKVVNQAAASGGAEAETLNALVERMPRTIRHRDRAVTVEDYQDLAMLATPEVARARCVPLYDLSVDPDAQHLTPGLVSVIIVPRSSIPKPIPSQELINRVHDYLDARRLPTQDLIVVGPDYVRVDVDTEIAPVSLENTSQLEAAILNALLLFLHPLSGGPGNAGWDFGRRPQKSDLYALLESVAGVDHVRALKIALVPDRANADKTDRFELYAGNINIVLKKDET